MFLNEFLKILCAWIIGGLLHILPEVIFSTILLLLLRKFAGGQHFKSNIVCFIVSVATLVCPVLMSILFERVVSTFWILIICIVEMVMIFSFSPYNKNITYSKKQNYIRKVLSVLIIILFFLNVYLFDIEIRYYLIIESIVFIEIMSLIRF